jgi:hypothetical protein
MPDDVTERRRKAAAKALRETLLPELNGHGLSIGRPCRVCGLALVRPEIVRAIHKDRLEGFSYRKLEEKYADDMRKFTGSVPSRELYRRHFDMHLAVDLETAVQNVRSLVDTSVVSSSEVETGLGILASDNEDADDADDAELDAMLPALPPLQPSAAITAVSTTGLPPVIVGRPSPATMRLNEDDSDYFELWELYDKLKPLLENLYNVEVASLANGEYRAYNLALLMKIFSEGRKFLGEANRMKNSDRLMRLILEAHTKRFVRILSEPLGHSLKSFLLRMRRNELSPDEFEKFLNEQLVGIFQAAATKSMAMSCEEYKLVH